MHSSAGLTLAQSALKGRDDRWLDDSLERIWSQYFGDTPPANVVWVTFGAPWKCRLGLITMTEDQSATYIQVNALLRRFEVPEVITGVTIAHELVHYAHGFGSPLPRRYKHPHRGGIVRRELLRRGMKNDVERYDSWICNHWHNFYAEIMDLEPRPSELMELGQVASELPANQ